jgi:hypothetical protein
MNTSEATVEEQFAVGEDCALSIGNVSGRITIRAGEPGTIAMRALKRGRDRSVENTWIETAQDGNRVRIRTRSEETGFMGINRGMCSVYYDITVPVGCAVEARAVSADISVTGTLGSLELDTVSGDGVVEDISGSCALKTVSGDVKARRVTAPLGFRSTSGDFSLRDSSLSELNAHTVSGDLTIETPLNPEGQYYAKTVSGDLTLVVPGESGATVELQTVSGRVTTDFPTEIVRAGRRHWQGRFNGGGAHIEMKSVSGNLRIRAGSPVPVVPTRSSEEHDAAVNQALSALERGEITVEEAMRRIKGQPTSV